MHLPATWVSVCDEPHITPSGVTAFSPVSDKPPSSLRNNPKVSSLLMPNSQTKLQEVEAT